MHESRRFGPGILATVLIPGLAGCGGDSGVAPSPPVTPPATPPPPEVVSEGHVGLDPLYLYLTPFTTGKAGSLEATVQWTFATNDVDAYVAKGNCSFDQFVAEQCNIVGFAESFTAKPEKVTVSTAAAGSYTLFIGNVGPERESISYQVVLTPSASASSSSRAEAATPERGKVPSGAWKGMVAGHE
jgi:hypothetical protein